jgi:Ulp1 family protease
MSNLRENGAESMVKWTKQKDIDVFRKKLVFIPINEAEHWSLCVLVNPGLIEFDTAEEGTL